INLRISIAIRIIIINLAGYLRKHFHQNMYQRSIIGILSLLIIWIASFGSQLQRDIDVVENTPVADVHTPNDEKQTGPESSLKIVAYEAVLPLIQANVTTIAYFFIKLQVTL